MNMKEYLGWKRTLCAAMLGGMILMGACDDSITGSVITVTPPSSDLTGPGSVHLTAALPEDTRGTQTNRTDDLFLPLEWSVNNPNLGRIAPSGGHSAVYVSNGRAGQNVVFVKDQSGREGLASVNQK